MIEPRSAAIACVTCCCALLSLLTAPTARAIAETRCDTSAAAQLPGEAEVLDADTGPGACASLAQVALAIVNSTAGADFGAVFASAEGTYLEGDTDRAEAEASAQFRDTVTVTSPGLDGQTGRIEASVRLTGFIDLTGSGNGAVSVNATAPAGGADGISFSCFGGSPTGCEGRPYPAVFDEVVPVALDVQFGAPGNLGITLIVQATRNSISTSPGTSDVNFGSTATWGGIEQVTFQGAPVPFTIISESGTDYTVAVPEPGQAALALAGGLALAATRRRAGRGPAFAMGA